MAKELWVDYRHPEYHESKRRRTFSRDQYSGNALEVTLREAKRMAHERAVVSAIDEEDGNSVGVRVYDSLGGKDRYGTYLHRRSQGEMGAAFAERARITPFPSHYSALVDSMVGGVFAVEDKADREYSGPLGSPDDRSGAMYGFVRDVDGTGVNMEAWLISAAGKMIVDEWFWYRVDRVTEDDPIRAYWVDPDTILNWREEDGVPVELLQKEMRYEQANLKEKGRYVKYYRLWTLDGWELYRELEKEESPSGEREIVFVDQREYAFPFFTDTSRTRRRLPFGRTRLPLSRPVGYQMAQDHNMLYNLLSDARWNFRVINHPRLAGDVDDDQWVRSMHTLMEGVNALQGDWKYISPEAENGWSAFKVYTEKVQHFFIDNHQRMNSAAVEKSAAQAMFDEAAGRTAFLRIHAAAVDEVENDVYFLAAQWESPENPSSWYGTWVKRSSDFKPIDILAQIKQQADAFAAVAKWLDTDSALRFARDGAVDGLTEREQPQPIQVIPQEEPEQDQEEEDV